MPPGAVKTVPTVRSSHGRCGRSGMPARRRVDRLRRRADPASSSPFSPAGESSTSAAEASSGSRLGWGPSLRSGSSARCQPSVHWVIRSRRALAAQGGHFESRVEPQSSAVTTESRGAIGDPAQDGTHAHALAHGRVADEFVADRKEAHPSIEGRGRRLVPRMSGFPALLYGNLNIAVAQWIPVQTVGSNTSGSCRSHNEATGSMVRREWALRRRLHARSPKSRRFAAVRSARASGPSGRQSARIGGGRCRSL